jgi:hypothetical protein
MKKHLLFFAFLFTTQLCTSSVIYVSNLFDSGAGSLRNSINIASAGDTIDFSVQGTIQIDSPLVINRNLYILSPSDDSIEISASGHCRILEITGGKVFIFGIFFIGGYSDSITSGGVIWKSSSDTMIIRSSTFFSSGSTYHGGGIVQDSGTTNIYRTYFYNLTADSSGGAIRSNGGTFFVYNCTFEAGNSGLSGAAISNHGGVFSIVNSTFYNNNAGLYGGACEGDSINLINCTVTGNTALSGGGGIKSGNGFVKNSIIYDNHAQVGPNFLGAFDSFGYNLLGDTSGSGTLTSHDLYGLNPMLGPISYSNGGLTPTCSLAVGSPCIDAGNCINAPTADQRDSLRIGLPDIGSYEFGGTPFTTTITSNSLCSGDTIFFGNDTIVSSGIYMQILTASSGCDSAVQLTISTIPDIAVTQNSVTLTASALPNSYQWYDCNSNSILPNETSQSFTATLNGSYAVIVTQNGCTDTSLCTVINNVDVESLAGNNAIAVFPSILNDELNIQFGTAESGSIYLFSVTGELILEKYYSRAQNIVLPVKELVAGVYLLDIRSSNRNYRTKLIK